MSAITPRGIRHVLLDIEGTTCPISFVAQTLFPYAASHLPGFLEGHRQAPAIQRLVAELRQLWSDDPDPEAQQLLRQAHASGALGDGGDPADLPTAIVQIGRAHV